MPILHTVFDVQNTARWLSKGEGKAIKSSHNKCLRRRALHGKHNGNLGTFHRCRDGTCKNTSTKRSVKALCVIETSKEGNRHIGDLVLSLPLYAQFFFTLYPLLVYTVYTVYIYSTHPYILSTTVLSDTYTHASQNLCPKSV
jgi:hypothetical protein